MAPGENGDRCHNQKARKSTGGRALAPDPASSPLSTHPPIQPFPCLPPQNCSPCPPPVLSNGLSREIINVYAPGCLFSATQAKDIWFGLFILSSKHFINKSPNALTFFFKKKFFVESITDVPLLASPPGLHHPIISAHGLCAYKFQFLNALIQRISQTKDSLPLWFTFPLAFHMNLTATIVWASCQHTLCECTVFTSLLPLSPLEISPILQWLTSALPWSLSETLCVLLFPQNPNDYFRCAYQPWSYPKCIISLRSWMREWYFILFTSLK